MPTLQSLWEKTLTDFPPWMPPNWLFTPLPVCLLTSAFRSICADLGVKEADFPYMAEMALKDGNAFSNPRKGNEKEIAEIFRQAF